MDAGDGHGRCSSALRAMLVRDPVSEAVGCSLSCGQMVEGMCWVVGDTNTTGADLDRAGGMGVIDRYDPERSALVNVGVVGTHVECEAATIGKQTEGIVRGHGRVVDTGDRQADQRRVPQAGMVLDRIREPSTAV